MIGDGNPLYIYPQEAGKRKKKVDESGRSGGAETSALYFPRTGKKKDSGKKERGRVLTKSKKERENIRRTGGEA